MPFLFCCYIGSMTLYVTPKFSTGQLYNTSIVKAVITHNPSMNPKSPRRGCAAQPLYKDEHNYGLRRSCCQFLGFCSWDHRKWGLNMLRPRRSWITCKFSTKSVKLRKVNLIDLIQSLHSKVSQSFYRIILEEISCSDSVCCALSQYFSRRKPGSSSLPEYRQIH